MLDGERNQLIPSAPPQGGRSRFSSHTHACEVYHIPSSKTILAHPCGLGSLLLETGLLGGVVPQEGHL